MRPVLPTVWTATLLLLLPLCAHAEQSTVWDFQDNNVPGRWEVKGLTGVQPSVRGLVISTSTLGKMSRPTELDHPIEAITLTYTAQEPVNGYVLWHISDSPSDDLVQYPFQLQASQSPTTFSLNLGPEKQWDARTDHLGLAFEPGSQLLLESMELRHWNIFEKGWEAAKSFWVFDTYRPYSINFIWGPQMTYSPVAREDLFKRLPPLAHSANRFFYLILIAGLAVLIVKLTKHKGESDKQQEYLWKFFLLFASLWVFYDIRMGTEFISYFVHDAQTFHLQDPSRQEFRERSSFMTFAQSVRPYLAEEKYVFMATAQWPYLGLMRYETYPIIPTLPTQALEGVRTWVIYKRPDIVMNANRQLEAEGQILSNPGTVVHEFESGTFVFVANQ